MVASSVENESGYRTELQGRLMAVMSSVYAKRASSLEMNLWSADKLKHTKIKELFKTSKILIKAEHFQSFPHSVEKAYTCV